MSPLSLRRYRAERLLRREFQALSERVLATVASKLSARGVRLGVADLEECYAQAWQGLYMAIVEGQEIDNTVGWLVTVTSRRAIDEHRRRERWRRDELADLRRVGTRADGGHAAQRDLASAIDDRARLRHVFEALAVQLTPEESEAATLCYLQGMSRAEAATRMGIGPARMERLMEGRGRGRPGVASKVGRLFSTIGAELWCEEQASLMRALAFGILAPDGPRYEIAIAHRRECPACRAYVVSLRGLAVVLPPVITPLHAGLLAATAAATSGASGGAISAAAGSGGTQTATVVVAASASGASSAAGGGWLLAGSSLSAKVIVGCALALGVGAGCAALGVSSSGGSATRSGRRGDAHRVAHTRYTASSDDAKDIPPDTDQAILGEHEQARLGGARGRGTSPQPNGLDTAISALVAGAAAREFGLEAIPTGSSSRTAPKLANRRAHRPHTATPTGAGSVSAAYAEFSPISSSTSTTSSSSSSTSTSSTSTSTSTSTSSTTTSSPNPPSPGATSDTQAATGAPAATRSTESEAAEREFGLG